MSTLEPLHIFIRGKHDMGKTAIAALIKEALLQAGFQTVSVADMPPLAFNQKPAFAERLARNLTRPIFIRVELE